MAVVVITGASSGIGAATARLLSQRGHQLVLAARRVDRLQALAAELAGQAEVLVVPADMAQSADIAALARRAGEHFGGIDVWINNAGVGHAHPWWQQPPADIERVLGVNLTAPILAIRAALPWLRRARRGHIINVASVAGHIGAMGIYSATKFGLRGLTESMRRELAPLGICVSLISPGFVRTEMTQNLSFPMPSAAVVARAIDRVIRRPRREVVVPGWYRAAIWLNSLFPWLVDWAMARSLPSWRKQ